MTGRQLPLCLALAACGCAASPGRAVVVAAGTKGAAATTGPPATFSLLPMSATSALDLALDDDLPLPPLLSAVESEIALLDMSTRVRAFQFGAKTFTKTAYLAGLRRFVALGRAAAAPADFYAAVKREFDFYEAAFPTPILVTAYYEPMLRGSRVSTALRSQPLYRPPPDPHARYLTRAQIDTEKKLAGQNLELCWVDPLDAFDLQTEGSGIVAFDDGTTLALSYAENNGQPHQRLSRYFVGKIPPDQLNMHTMQAYLRSLPEPEMRAILNQNPRYIFFRPRTEKGAATSLGLAATDGRTIAADPAFLPKGALGFLITTRPAWARPPGPVPVGFTPLRRFVLDQDTGSGIKGGHIDLFWGRGENGRLNAGAMKQHGTLYYLAPKTN